MEINKNPFLQKTTVFLVSNPQTSTRHQRVLDELTERINKIRDVGVLPVEQDVSKNYMGNLHERMFRAQMVIFDYHTVSVQMAYLLSFAVERNLPTLLLVKKGMQADPVIYQIVQSCNPNYSLAEYETDDEMILLADFFVKTFVESQYWTHHSFPKLDKRFKNSVKKVPA